MVNARVLDAFYDDLRRFGNANAASRARARAKAEAIARGEDSSTAAATAQPTASDQRLSANRVRDVHVILSGALGLAARWGWIPFNPALLVRPAGGKGKSRPVPTPEQVRELFRALAGILGEQLVGNYLHGSAVLSGFTRARSDIDLLAVTTSALTDNLKRQLAAALSQTALPCPADGLELSVVTHATTLVPVPTPPFELHLATATGPHGTAKVVDGRGHPGDPDLLLHFAVCRDHGRQLGDGPPPPAVFAPIPRAWLLAGLARELVWGERHGTVEYRVLNACRAWRFAEEGVLCSKVDGGRWARDRVEAPTMVDLAIARQQGQLVPLPDPATVSALVRLVLQRLGQQPGEPTAARGGE